MVNGIKKGHTGLQPDEAVSCIEVISPGVVMPYDLGESDPQVAADALAGSGIEVRVLALP